MHVYPVKAFSDNYIWVIEEGQEAVVVDPGESEGVIKHLKDKELVLHAIILTHEHNDHIGGVEAVLEEHPGIPVYGPVETKQLADHIVKDGDTFKLLNQTFKVMKTAGHSNEHISFLTEGALFCGDALFSGGCGRVFTGDYGAQYEALQIFNTLDNDTLVYAGHEYTQTNLKFAQSVQPDNQTIADALKEVEEKREQDKPTLPSTIEKEKAINLFLKAETLEDFISLRKERDEF